MKYAILIVRQIDYLLHAISQKNCIKNMTSFTFLILSILFESYISSDPYINLPKLKMML